MNKFLKKTLHFTLVIEFIASIFMFRAYSCQILKYSGISRNNNMIRSLLFYVLFFSTGCKESASFEFSVYWWKHKTDISTEQEQFIADNKIKSIYLKLFDLKWDAYNKTIIIPKTHSAIKTSVEVKAVIYIENDILKNYSADTIATIIHQQLDIAIEKDIINNINDLQIDCDWTISTREAYFELLELISQQIPNLSATIRLHQVKYAEVTGVPPIDKGVLMIYNLESPADTSVTNSIFNYDLAIQYLEGYIKKYPLHLDIALPAFSWGVHFHHGRIKQLISDFDSNQIDSSDMVQKENGYFRAKQAHFYNTYRISNRDEIRYEYPLVEDVKKMLKYLKQKLNQEETEVVFFSLNDDFLINNKKAYEKIIATHD